MTTDGKDLEVKVSVDGFETAPLDGTLDECFSRRIREAHSGARGMLSTAPYGGPNLIVWIPLEVDTAELRVSIETAFEAATADAASALSAARELQDGLRRTH